MSKIIENFAALDLTQNRVVRPWSTFALRGTVDNLRRITAGSPTEARFAWFVVKPSVARAKVGEYRARTGDLLVANQALSQLS